MTLANPWFILALVATAGLYHVELISTLLNLSALRGGIPARLRGILSDEDFERTQEYVRAKSALETFLKDLDRIRRAKEAWGDLPPRQDSPFRF